VVLNEALRDQLDSIAEIVAPDDTDENVTDEEDEDDDGEEEEDDPN
jgi:hypothetical protein